MSNTFKSKDMIDILNVFLKIIFSSYFTIYYGMNFNIGSFVSNFLLYNDGIYSSINNWITS